MTLNGQDVTAAIRTPEMSDGASRVSALPEVRTALLGLQRRIGAEGGVVVEGRDIGTVVFPDAEAKFFLTANADERARRRVAELAAAGKPVDAAQTKAEIVARDTRDSTRAARAAAQGRRRHRHRLQRAVARRGGRPHGRHRRRAHGASRPREAASASRGAGAARGRPGATPRRRGRRACAAM